MENIKKPIAERMRSARTAKGLSTTELAEACGISNSAVLMYESGRRVPRDSIKVVLSEALEVPIQDLFF